jgi:NAD(P)-dependent dehydrogenase (short-subunit alcohol dehydrogenase family)
MKSLSRKVAAEGITVNAIMPGSKKTRRMEELNISDTNSSTQGL